MKKYRTKYRTNLWTFFKTNFYYISKKINKYNINLHFLYGQNHGQKLGQNNEPIRY